MAKSRYNRSFSVEQLFPLSGIRSQSGVLRAKTEVSRLSALAAEIQSAAGQCRSSAMTSGLRKAAEHGTLVGGFYRVRRYRIHTGITPCLKPDSRPDHCHAA